MTDWEGGTRQGIRWRAVVIAVAVVVVAGSAVLSLRNPVPLTVEDEDEPAAEVSETVDVVIANPLQADDTWYCPSTHPVRAYTTSGRYEPSAYPGRARRDRPDRCYETVDHAETGGYRLAEPPPDTDVVAGVYVEPIGDASREHCRELADAVRYAVACPIRLPTPAQVPRCERRCFVPGPARPRARGGARNLGIVLQYRSFTIPREAPWFGVPRDVVFTAVPVGEGSRGQNLRFAGPPELVSCFPEGDIVPRGRDVFRTCVDARSYVPGFGGFPLQRHTAAVWRRGDVVYAAGIEGAGDHVDALLTALIDGIDYVDPPS